MIIIFLEFSNAGVITIANEYYHKSYIMSPDNYWVEFHARPAEAIRTGDL